MAKKKAVKKLKNMGTPVPSINLAQQKKKIGARILNHHTTSTMQQIINTMSTRSEAWSKMLDPRRDLDTECGYKVNPSASDYNDIYEKEGYAARVVHIIPEECWQSDPIVTENEEADETEFEKAWKEIEEQKDLYSIMARADVLSGLGRFGIILLGLNDGAKLKDEVVPREGMELLYLRVFDESVVQVAKLEKDSQNERYGLPVLYTVQFDDITNTKSIKSSEGMKVHWSRVVHLADNRRMSDVVGVRRLRNVYNRLQDIRKVAGGSAEMYWQGAFPGFNFEVDPALLEAGSDAIDTDALKNEMLDYTNGLQRALKTVGVKVHSLAPQVVDPTPQIIVQLKLIALAKGIPFRIFMGTEEGKLAGGQDAKAWAKRMASRQREYLTPYVVRPFIQQLINVGVLPEVEDFKIDWPNMLEVSEKEKAEVANIITAAMKAYVQGGVDHLIPPDQYLINIIGLDADLVEEMKAEIEAIIEQEEKDQAALEEDLRKQGLNPDGTPIQPEEEEEENEPPVPPVPPQK